jgi:hypothetical protein
MGHGWLAISAPAPDTTLPRLGAALRSEQQRQPADPGYPTTSSGSGSVKCTPTFENGGFSGGDLDPGKTMTYVSAGHRRYFVGLTGFEPATP